MCALLTGHRVITLIRTRAWSPCWIDERHILKCLWIEYHAFQGWTRIFPAKESPLSFNFRSEQKILSRNTMVRPRPWDSGTSITDSLWSHENNYALGENCALAANQSVDCRATILFTISQNSAKVWNRGYNWPVFGDEMDKKSPNVSFVMCFKCYCWLV